MVGAASGSGLGSRSGCGWWRLLGLGATEQNLWKYEKSRSCVAFSNGGTEISTPARLQRWMMREGWPRAALPTALAHRWISFAINCPTSITRPVRMVYRMVARPSVRSDTWEHGVMLACTNADQKRAKGEGNLSESCPCEILHPPIRVLGSALQAPRPHHPTLKTSTPHHQPAGCPRIHWSCSHQRAPFCPAHSWERWELLRW